MNKNLDPNIFNLHPRTVLEMIDAKTIAIVINRKSRIIMADGRKIMDKVKKIKKNRPEMRVVLKTTAPVCSRTAEFLASVGINVVYDEP